jgi:hypothetical protein
VQRLLLLLLQQLARQGLSCWALPHQHLQHHLLLPAAAAAAAVHPLAQLVLLPFALVQLACGCCHQLLLLHCPAHHSLLLLLLQGFLQALWSALY